MKNLSPELIKALGLTVMDALWQGALLLLVVLLFISIFKRASSRLKYRLIVIVMLAMPIWSLISFNNHYKPVTHTEVVPSTSKIAMMFPDLGSEFQASVNVVQESTLFERGLLWMDNNANFVAYFWLLGVAIFGLRLFGGLFYVRYIKMGAKPVFENSWLDRFITISKKIGVKAEVGLRESTKVSSPIVIGFLKPVVIFPIGLINGLPTDQIEAIMAHELAHVKRMDYLINLLLSALQVMYFFHPAYWWLYRQAEQEREYHCDQLAIAYIGNKVTLIKALTSVQELKLPGLIPAVAFASRKNQLLQRIVRIAEGRPRTNWVSGLVSMLLILTSFLLVSWQSSSNSEVADLPVNPEMEQSMTEPTQTVEDQSKLGSTVEASLESDTLPIPSEKIRREYEVFGAQFEYVLKNWQQLEDREMSGQTERLINQIETLEKTDSLELIDAWKLATASIMSDFVNDTKAQELSKLSLEDAYKRLKDEFQQLLDSQAKLEQGLVEQNKEFLEEAKERIGTWEQEVYEIQDKFSEQEQQELEELIELNKRNAERIDRQIVELVNERELALLELKEKEKWEELGLKEPIVRTVYSEELSITELNITEEHKEYGDFVYELYGPKKSKAIIELDGKLLDVSGFKIVNAMDIKELARIEEISGELLKRFYRGLESHKSLIRVMTKAYANSPMGASQIRRLQFITGFGKPDFFGRSNSRLLDFENKFHTILNGEVLKDVEPSKLFEEYGKAYTAYLRVPRILALELYGREFMGSAEGVFFPYINGKNTSADEFYEKLKALNEKLRKDESANPELVSNVKSILERKQELELAQNKLITAGEVLNEDPLIVVNDFVRKDLTIEDLKSMDIINLEVIPGDKAKSVYRDFLDDHVGVIKVTALTNSIIEYSNVLDPRDLNENKNQFRLPPYQSEIEAFDKAFESELVKDKLIDKGAINTIFLENGKMMINYEEQPSRILKKYLKLYKKTMGFSLDEKITYYYHK